ncbi:hypothetical protein [Chlamydia sp. 04-14]|uniref:hypothetical protein n=1 Tax=Chlamydia TaxID=810 RepID=UPI002FC9EF37
MSISATSAQNQEPLNLFSKGSEARGKLIHFIVHCIIQTLVLTILTAGIVALGCCMHPMFFIFLLAIIPVYISLRNLATDKLRDLYITFRVYPSEDKIYDIVFF